MRAAPALAVVVASLLLLTATPASGEPVSGPRLSVGDAWTYRTNTSVATGFFLDGQVTLTVAATGPVTVDGIAYDGVQYSVTGAGIASGTLSQLGSTPASGRWVLAGEDIVESGGLKVVSSVLDVEANGTLHTEPFAVPFQLSVQNTTTYRFSEDAWRFPLGIGNSTLVRGEMNFTEDFRLSYGLTMHEHASGIVAWNVTYALEAAVSVDTPIGRFDAYRIREGYPDGSYSLLFYAPTAGNYARTESHNGTSQVATTELTSYRYQALQPGPFLGLTTDRWAIFLAAVATTGVLAAFWRRRKRRRFGPLPPNPPASP